MGGEPMAPVTMAHLQVALAVQQYRHDFESICMTAGMQEAPSLAAPQVQFELVEAPAEMAHEGMRESWIGFTPMRTRELMNGEEAGSTGWVILPHVARSEERRVAKECRSRWSPYH